MVDENGTATEQVLDDNWVVLDDGSQRGCVATD